MVTPANYALCPVNVTIVDVNDNAPTFLFPAANKLLPDTTGTTSGDGNTVRISSLTPSGTRIVRLNATDADVNSTTSFSQVIPTTSDQNTPQQPPEFVVDPLTGWITTAVDFKGVQFARKTLQVLAIDADSPRLFRTSGILYVVVDSAAPVPGADPVTNNVLSRRNLVILVAICVSFAIVSFVLLAAILVKTRKRRRMAHGNTMDNCKFDSQLKDSAVSSRYSAAILKSGTLPTNSYALTGYSNETMRYSTGRNDFDDTPTTLYENAMVCCYFIIF